MENKATSQRIIVILFITLIIGLFLGYLLGLYKPNFIPLLFNLLRGNDQLIDRKLGLISEATLTRISKNTITVTTPQKQTQTFSLDPKANFIAIKDGKASSPSAEFKQIPENTKVSLTLEYRNNNYEATVITYIP